MRHPPLPKLSKLYQAFLVLLAKKTKEAEVLHCLSPQTVPETKAGMQPAGITGKIISREAARPSGGRCCTHCPRGTLHTHPVPKHRFPAKRRKDALISGKPQPSPSLQPNCPGALASRPKPGYPLAEPHGLGRRCLCKCERQGCFCLQAAGNGAVHPTSSPGQERAPRKEITQARRFDGMNPLGGLKIAINGELSLIAFV